MEKRAATPTTPPKTPSIQSSGLIGSGINQMTLSDATVKKIFKLAAQRAAGKK